MKARHNLRRRDVVLVPFPYSDLTTSKQRPALVVSSDTYHATQPDVILAAITSQVPPRVPPTDHRLREWKAAGLLFPSIVKSSLVTIDPALIRYRIGKLTDKDMSAVDHALRNALDL